MSARSSLRFRDAPIGAIGLLSIAMAVMLLPIVGLGSAQRSVRGALSLVFLLFAPAILSALYSLLFERSKIYGGFDLALAAIALAVQPLTWYWIDLYLPITVMFIGFCVLLWALGRKRDP
jgi:hypothetical protein